MFDYRTQSNNWCSIGFDCRTSDWIRRDVVISIGKTINSKTRRRNGFILREFWDVKIVIKKFHKPQQSNPSSVLVFLFLLAWETEEPARMALGIMIAVGREALNHFDLSRVTLSLPWLRGKSLSNLTVAKIILRDQGDLFREVQANRGKASSLCSINW